METSPPSVFCKLNKETKVVGLCGLVKLGHMT